MTKIDAALFGAKIAVDFRFLLWYETRVLLNAEP
jgi:hypothetical protein